MNKWSLILLALVFNTTSFGINIKMDSFVKRVYNLGYQLSYETEEDSYHTVNFDKKDGQFRKNISLTKEINDSEEIDIVSRYIHQKDRTNWVEKDIFSSLNKLDGVIPKKMLNKIIEELKTINFNNPPKNPTNYPEFNIEKNTTMIVMFHKNYINLVIRKEEPKKENDDLSWLKEYAKKNNIN